MKVFFAWPPPLSVSPSLRLMYHVYTFGALMSLLASAIGQEEKKDAIDDDNEKGEYSE